jgi:hypothetical protein
MKVKVTVEGKHIKSGRQVVEFDTDKAGTQWHNIAQLTAEIDGKPTERYSLAVSFKGHVTLEKQDRIPGYPKEKSDGNIG